MARFVSLFVCLLVLPVAAYADDVRDTRLSTPLVLSDEQGPDHTVYNVQISRVKDSSALTLVGRLHTVLIDSCRIGNVVAGLSGRASGLDTANTMISSLTVVNTTFYDAEGPLVNLTAGSFGTVTFDRCTFLVSESFRRKMQTRNPWRQGGPAVQFANIHRLELLDNDFADIPVVIHPSVRQVVVRGPIANLHLLSEKTEMVILDGPPAVEPVAVATAAAPQL